MPDPPRADPPTARPRPEQAVIGLCTFNRGERFLPTLRAIAALDRLGGRVTRVVIVDNASNDATPHVVARFAAEHPHAGIEVVREPVPGKVAALRRLFAETDEPLVLTLDDDTLPAPDWAARLISVFDAHPRAGIVGGALRIVWEAGPTPLAGVYKQSLGHMRLPPRLARLDDPAAFVPGASMGVRRAALHASGWLDGTVLRARTGSDLECGAEDAEVCIRVRQAGWEVWLEPAAEAGHLVGAERQTRDYLARLRGAICRGEPRLWWLARGRPRDAGALRWARRHLARARRDWLRTALTNWRPSRRRIRLAERAGRRDGWAALVRDLLAPDSPRGDPR